MVNYQLGKIYKISCDVSDYVYIGSTCNSLKKRMRNHRKRVYRYFDKNNYSPLYQYIRKIGVEHFKIELIKEFPCNNKQELLLEERNEIDKINSKIILNVLRPIVLNYNEVKVERRITRKEYYLKNKKTIIERNSKIFKEYKKKSENLKKIKEYSHNYYEKNKEKIVLNQKRNYFLKFIYLLKQLLFYGIDYSFE